MQMFPITGKAHCKACKSFVGAWRNIFCLSGTAACCRLPNACVNNNNDNNSSFREWYSNSRFQTFECIVVNIVVWLQFIVSRADLQDVVIDPPRNDLATPCVCVFCVFFTIAYVLYYCSTVGWTWCDWSLILWTLSAFSPLTLLVASFDPRQPVHHISYNEFGGTLNFTRLQL